MYGHRPGVDHASRLCGWQAYGRGRQDASIAQERFYRRFRSLRIERRDVALIDARFCLRIIGDYGESLPTVIHSLLKLKGHPGRQVAWLRYTRRGGRGRTGEWKAAYTHNHRTGDLGGAGRDQGGAGVSDKNGKEGLTAGTTPPPKWLPTRHAAKPTRPHYLKVLAAANHQQSPSS
ncbi:hypothetical protein D3C84_353570 [compost metagenome]